MAKDLSLKIAVKLLTKNFKSGVKSLTSALRTLQMQGLAFAAAMGAGGLGLRDFISRMRETAKETSRANITLKNVSASVEEFASSQRWLIELSRKYGVGINTLTLSYAKFKAAADQSNMSLTDQRNLFDSVARASAAYGLTAEDQRGVFMAFQQMMSKGKVMAEELRLQLAERLPVATLAMARAAGVSVEELDKMMKKGQVLAKDVLPRFAEELRKMIPSIDTNNLNKSLVDFENAFVNLTKNFKFEGLFKGLVDFATASLNLIAQHASKVTGAIKMALYGLAGLATIRIFRGFASEADAAIATAKRVRDQIVKAEEGVTQAKAALQKAETAKQQASDQLKALSANATAAERIEAEVRYTRAANREASARLALDNKEQALKRANAMQTAELKGALELQNAGRFRRALIGLTATSKRLGQTIAAALKTTVWMAVIGVALKLIAKLGEAVAKMVKIRNYVKRTREELAKPIAASSNEIDVQTNYRILRNSSKSYSEDQRAAALMRINELLGTEYKLTDNISQKYSEIEQKIRRYTAYLSAQAKLERAKSKYAEEEQNLRDYLRPKYKESFGRLGVRRNLTEEEYYNLHIMRPDAYLDKEGRAIFGSMRLAEANIEKWASEVARYAGEFTPKLPTTIGGGGGGGADTPTESATAKLSQQYAEQVNQLVAQRAASLITEREYERALRDLIEKTYAEANASGDAGVLNSAFYRGLSSSFGRFSHGEQRANEEALQDAILEYHNNIKEQDRLLAAGAIAQEEYNAAMRELTKSIYETISSFDLSKMPESQRELAMYERDLAAVNNPRFAKKTEPSRGPSAVEIARMSEAEKLRVRLELEEDSLANLRAVAEDSIASMIDEIAAKEGKIKSLSQSLAIAEAKEELKELNREITRGRWGTITSAVHGVDGVTSSVERLKETLSDVDASGWDKFIAAFEVLEGVTNTIFSVADGIRELTEATKAAAAVRKAQASAERQEAAQSVTANTAVAASEAGKTAAKTPMPLFAKIAAVGMAIAAVIAAFATLPKFAKGGVVGGNSRRGDKVLARLNSGEGVLTDQGMANLDALAGAAAHPATNIHITGELTASGRSLRLVLDRQARHDSRTK